MATTTMIPGALGPERMARLDGIVAAKMPLLAELEAGWSGHGSG
jgi:hypothetical protein